ncbi:ubiquitin-like-specific protease 1A [Diospyros lotus]|uniref:ubiquitin-like-specific protease 1A n=1 Tax=Diospyros lotus TaxID=55363 RepID=UPI00225796DB|nr:ubiquitin-like-specific protease 1A [Diospyros lotus]
MDSGFWQFVKKAYHEMGNPGRKNLEYEFGKELVNYVKGVIPSLGKPWSICRYLYLPYCIPRSHWFAIEVDLQERQINILDSLPSSVHDAQLSNYMKPVRMVIPWLMKLHVNENYNTSMLKYKRVRPLPEQNNGSDCGLFTVKFIEFSLAGLDLSLVQAEHMMMWRVKMAAEIFAWHFDP